jgi:Ca-activated chloride channel homolog
MLILDVSLSMCTTAIAPSRLRAAESAALAFIRRQPPSTQIGVVTFASFAVLVQSPTTDQQSLQSAVEHLDTGLGTAIGSGILTALEAIEDLQAVPGPTAAAPPQPGYAPEIIVLLTDGVTTVRPANRHQVV